MRPHRPSTPPPSYEESLRISDSSEGYQGRSTSDPGFFSTHIFCPNCQLEIKTVTSFSPSMLAWAMSSLLCFTVLWPCACVPLFMDSMLNVKHSCPVCGKVLARFRGGEM